jgi:chromosome segregation ATPase
MEFEQIVKRLEWLDEEHRKEKSALEILSERLARIEGELNASGGKLKDLDSQFSKLTSVAARIEKFDLAFAQQRKEIVKYIDELEKKSHARQQEVDKQNKAQLDSISRALTEQNQAIQEIKRELKAAADEEAHRGKIRTDWEARMQLMVKTVEEFQHTQKITEESFRQNSKRLTDLQGEISAVRKRMDETREKTDLMADDVHRTETRLNEVIASETERKQLQASFIEQQVRTQVERDKAWKEWEERLATLRKQSDAMDKNLQDWDSAQRALKRAQETYEEITQKFERRINEVSEMQRLAEDRFRQEWVTFKADDQKRWTSYTLGQDETHRDTRSSVEKMEQRLTAMEDLAQTQQDVLQQTKEANEQLFQGMLAQIHELLSAYERIMGTK